MRVGRMESRGPDIRGDADVIIRMADAPLAGGVRNAWRKPAIEA
ncbi:hypothetical protein ACFONG_00355 [Uliginosibacterium paludis]|uniref:Uncharacterized protein n=1 Tax=Uliginosibacterium paludis TaxID=1615952 RepID=A0ABV2CRE2_9RHOO